MLKDEDLIQYLRLYIDLNEEFFKHADVDKSLNHLANLNDQYRKLVPIPFLKEGLIANYDTLVDEGWLSSNTCW